MTNFGECIQEKGGGGGGTGSIEGTGGFNMREKERIFKIQF